MANPLQCYVSECGIMIDYDFEWDVNKASANKHKHGVSFDRASRIFLDPLALTVYDETHSDYEERWNTLGLDAEGQLLVVAHTFQLIGPSRARVRIISARVATKQEQRCYENKPH